MHLYALRHRHHYLHASGDCVRHGLRGGLRWHQGNADPRTSSARGLGAVLEDRKGQGVPGAHAPGTTDDMGAIPMHQRSVLLPHAPCDALHKHRRSTVQFKQHAGPPVP